MRSPWFFVLGLLVCPWSAAWAQDEPETRFRIRGFINASAFLQDEGFGFGNGQNATFAASGAADVDQWFLGGDVRNTRLTIDLLGPDIFPGWSAGGTVEFDLFGGFAGTSPLSDEQPQPRLRLAYVEVRRPGTTIRLGQAWAPLFGNVPVSTSHFAFPLGYGSTGMIGWRFPGVFLYQDLTRADAPTRVQLQLASFRGSWTGAPGDILDQRSAGEASVIPQLEARLDVSGRLGESAPWGVYLVGHVDRKDLSGPGQEAEADILTGKAVEVGARFAPAPLTLHGNAYWGRAIGQQLGNLTQFGDISGSGSWIQAGYAFAPQWSAWAFYGEGEVDDAEVRRELLDPFQPTTEDRRRDARRANRMWTLGLRFTSGPYSLGGEWLHALTDWSSKRLSSGGAVEMEDFVRGANQLSLSVVYHF